MELSKAIEYLKQCVKFSAIPGQKHLDFGLLPAEKQETAEAALKVVHKAIFKGEITEAEFQNQVGLN